MAADAVFEVAGDVARATSFAAGPWDPSMQHGGAPASLIAWVVERIPTAVPMQVVRLTLDLLRPVPIAPLTIRTEVVREGKKIQLCAVSLFADDKEVVRASALKVRLSEFPDLASLAKAGPDLPPPEASPPIDETIRRSSGFISGLEVRSARGGFDLLGAGGPGACWFRSVRPIVAGEENTPLMRAAMTSDFSNGVSSMLGREWTFLNADLAINLLRMPIGEWVLLDAETWIGESGAGIASGILSDRHGVFGRAVQNLVIDRR